ncbi:MAG: endolytic transglycosylase MltG [Acidobacteria bacterium]|nr:MAG: endolytic transglycosylase MltG [Acidobacteriota bacterium]
MVRFIAILLLVAILWLAWALAIPIAPKAPQVLLFPPGSSSRLIAAELERAGVIRNKFAFEFLHYAMPKKKLKAGEYRFVRAANGLEIFERIARGDVVVHTVVVPEGFNMFEIAAAVEAAGLGKKQDFLAVAIHETALIHNVDPQAKSLEGYLFPDTYQFTRTMTMRDMATAMVRRFQKEAQTLGLQHDAHRLVTLASIVEKETAAPDERPEVASVYVNRLAKNMALAADPTVVYAAMLKGNYRGTIYQGDLQSDSPYNTYKFAGLPPGPIANPGAASLRAAMKPANTNYLFFVAVGDGSGRHHFSARFEQHQRNVVAYRKAMKAR